MLHGTPGRTDLVGDEHTTKLAHAQYHSVQRLAAELPAHTRVYPTHGFGSFCSATPSAGTASTIGEQKCTNPALTQDEHSYVDSLIAGLSAYPAYYVHMGVTNRNGPAPVDLSDPVHVDASELRRRIEAGEWVVDLRSRTAYAAEHLAGTLGFELSKSFVTYLGWLYQWGAPLTLIGDNQDQIRDARRQLVRIGIDKLAGAAFGGIALLGDAIELPSYRTSDFTGLSNVRGRSDISVLDVRQVHEYEAGHIPGALNIPLHELLDRIDEVPNQEVWVHCGSGYRASIAASILSRAHRRVVLVDDDFHNADNINLAA